jgi:murein endopeptidase
MSAFAAEYGPSLEGQWTAADSGPVEDTAGTGCSDQYLQNGVQLPDLPLFYVRMTPDEEWGTPEMVNTIVDAARHMSWVMPTASRIVIGNISRHGGGFLSGHVSHRGGVDADIGIYAKGGKQPAHSFQTLAPSQLDVEATWMLMSTFLNSGQVDFILIDRGHIAVLRAYTIKSGLLTQEEADRIFPAEGSRDGWANTGIVRHAPNHQNHMHVRVLCGDGTRAGY